MLLRSTVWLTGYIVPAFRWVISAGKMRFREASLTDGKERAFPRDVPEQNIAVWDETDEHWSSKGKATDLD